MLTHGNLLANLEQCQAHPGRAQGADDVVFGVLPLFHIFGLNVVLGLSLRRGRHGAARRALRPAVGPRVDRQPRRHRHQRRADDVGGVGRAARTPAGDAFATVRLATSGAAKLDPQVQRADRATASASSITEGYGLTEASPVVTSGTGLDAPGGQHRRAAARPARAPRRRRRRRTRSSATPARSGCRAPTCSPATGTIPRPPPAALTADGWLRTGDVAVVDDDGFLFLVDRVEGPHHRVGLQRVPGRGRGGHRRAPGGRRRSRWSACPTRTRARR